VFSLTSVRLNGRRPRLALTGLFLVFALSAKAQVVTWYWLASGAGVTDDYSNPANWQGGVVPTNDGMARLQLPLATGPEVMVLPDGALAIDSIYLTLGSYYGTSYRFSSAGATTLSLAAGINSPNHGYSRSVQFDPAVTINLTADQTWTPSYVIVGGAMGGPGKLTIQPHSYYSSSYLNQGYLQLNGPGNFTGGLNVYNTTLTLGHAQALDGSGPVFLYEVRLETPLQLNLNRALTVGGTISSYQSENNGRITFAGPITLMGGATFDNLDYSGTGGFSPMVISGNITEAAETPGASLGLSGGAILLSGTNTYTGTTHVNGRAIFATAQSVAPMTTLHSGVEGYAGVAFTSGVQTGFINRLSSESFTGTIGFDTLSGPTQVFAEDIDLSGHSQYFGLGTMTSAILAGTINPGEGNDYRFGNGGGLLTVTSALTGSRRVLINSLGYQAPTTVVLQGNNTFTGGVEVNGGAVVFAAAGALPATGSITLTAGDNPLNLAYAGTTEDAGLTPGQFLARLDLRAPHAIVGFDSAIPTSPRTIFDPIDHSLGLQEGAPRTEPYFLGTSTKVILAGSITTGGGSVPLQLAGFKGGELIVDSVLGPVIPSVVVGLDLNSSNVEGLTGMVRLNGANSYAGGTLFQSGILALGHGTALGSGVLTLANNYEEKQLLFADGLPLANDIQGNYGMLDLGAAESTTSLTLTGAIGNNVHLNYLGAGVLTYAGTNPHLGSLTTAVEGNPNVIFAREAAGAGSVELQSGVLSVNAATGVAWLQTQSGTTVQIAEGKTLTLGYNNYSEGAAAHDIEGVIAGAGSLHIEDNAAMLNGANSFSGGLVLSGGTVGFVNVAALGTGVIRVAGGSYSDSSFMVLAPDLTVTNPILLQSFSVSEPATLTLHGSDHFFYGDYTIPGNRNLTLTGQITGTGNLRKQTNNTVTLTGANTFTGDIVVDQGIMVFTTAATTGDPTNRLNFSNYYSSSSATARFLAGNPQIGALIGYSYDSTATVELGTGVNLTIGVHDYGETGDQYYYGTITGDGSLTKEGPAQQTLIGANTYTGGTTVNQGTLIAGHNQAFGTGEIMINGGRLGAEYGVTFTNSIMFGANGGVLAGNGTFTQPLTIGPGVGLAPGYSPGTMTFSDLTLEGGGFFEFEIMDPTLGEGVGYDTLQVGGTLNLTATPGNQFRINLISLDSYGQPGAIEYGTFGTTYTLLLATSDSLNGFNPANFQLDTSAFTLSYAAEAQFFLTASGNDLMLNFTPVPEPSTYALLVLGVGMLWFVRRRR